MKKKIFMSVFALMLGLVLMLTSNYVQAATQYDWDAIKITIPAKFEKGELYEYVSEDKSFGSISYDIEDVGNFGFSYNKVSSDMIVLRPYTQADVDEYVKDIEEWDFEDEEFSQKFELLDSGLVYIDNIPTIKTRMKITSVNKVEKETICDYVEEYSINTNKYSFNIYVRLNEGSQSYLDSTEFKNVIKNIDIKDTITKNLPEYETFKHEYMDVTIPEGYINPSASIYENKESDYSYLGTYLYNNTINFNYNYFFSKDYGLKEYTNADVTTKAAEIDGYDSDSEYNTTTYTILNKELVTIDGVSAIKIRYQVKDVWKDSEGEMISYYEKYFINTDNTNYEISFDTYKDKSLLDSAEIKKIVNSIQIKDTVKNTRVTPFTDVSTTKWYYNAVKYCYTNKIILGTNDYTFAPNNKLTRGMLVTILYRMEGSPKVTTENKFSDVASGKYYYNAVVWAESKGIVSGYKGTTKFGPNDNITRQDLAGMLSNYARYKNKYVKSTKDLSSFSDSSKISTYALPAMKWAVQNKVMNGSDGKLNPKGNATRAEAAAMLSNYCLNIK